MKHRVRAGLIHLALSAAIAAAVFLPIYFYWYPDVLFDRAGGRDLFLLIVGVDVVIGPLITFIIYVPKKKGLVFDLAVIAFLQSAALAYGVYVLFESRPAYIVFVKEGYDLVRANQLPATELAKARGTGYEKLPLAGPKWVGSRLPQDRDERLRIMTAALAGMDLPLFPQHYVPYEDVRAEVRAAAMPLEILRKRNPGTAGEVGATLQRLGRKDDEVRFLPLRTGKSNLAVFVDAKTGDVLKITPLNPWGD
jgi:hypothetical protein